jgi:hypothetical protein
VVHFGWLQVLAKREYVEAIGHKVVHGFVYFVSGFAEAKHNARLGAFAK